MADTPQEGEITFTTEVDADNTATDSPPETNETEETPSAEGGDDDNTQQDDDDGEGTDDAGNVDEQVPFHEHPRWKQRESEWESRFNNQEARHQEDMKKLREEFSGNKPTGKPESKPIPSWFGGTQEQWDAYQADLQEQFKEVEEKAFERFQGSKTEEQKAVEEATKYMKSELTAIEADPTLNPSGKKVDPNKLLKVVMDNELIDSKGRWNYRAGMKILNSQNPQAKRPAKPTQDKKKLAGATTSEPTGETQPKNFKTSKDFQQNRPW